MAIPALILCLLLIGGSVLRVNAQFGPGNAVTIPLTPRGENIAYVYPLSLGHDTKEFSIDIWYRSVTRSGVNNTAIVSIAHPADDNFVYLLMDGLWSQRSSPIVAFKPTPEANKWHHYAVSVSRHSRVLSNGTETEYIEGFVDGVSQGFATLVPFFFEVDYSADLSVVLGVDQDTILGQFDPGQSGAGYFDNLRVWRKAFKAAEWRTLMHIGLRADPHLVAGWDFDEGSGYTSREFVSGAPELAMNFASTRYTVDELRAKQLVHCGERKTATGWAASGARVFGSNLVMAAAAGASRRLALEDLVPAGETVTIESVSGGRLSVAVGTTTGEDLMWTAPERMETPETIVFRSQGMRTTITLRPIGEVVPENITVTLTEDPMTEKTLVSLPATSPENFPVRAVITQLPQRGRLFQHRLHFRGEEITQPGTVLTADSLSLQFAPGVNEFASPYATFKYKLVDEGRMDDAQAVGRLREGTVTINVRPSNDLPQLLSNVGESETVQELPVLLSLDAVDTDGDDALVSVQSLPEHGTLWFVDQNGTLLVPVTRDAAGTNEVEQFASAVVNFSTEYGTGEDGWSAFQVLGEPASQMIYGDSEKAWCPSSANGDCVNRGSETAFYTEFLHLRFEQHVHVTHLYIFSNLFPGSVSGVLAFDFDRRQWRRLYQGTVDFPVKEQEYLVWEPPGMCGTHFKTNEIFIEFDTCNRDGWNEVDAVMLVGTLDYNTGHVVPGARVAYLPEGGYSGEDRFTFRVTDCGGNRFRESTEHTYNITVHAGTPSATLRAGDDSRSAVDLSGHDGPFYVLHPPSSGRLFLEGVSSSQLQRTAKFEGGVEYLPDYRTCLALGDAFRDRFVLAVGSLYGRRVEIEVVGCEEATPFPFWVFGVVGGVVAVAAIAVGWKVFAQRRRMAALYNNNRVAEECAEAIAVMRLEELDFLFTLEKPNRIQRSFMSIVANLKQYRDFMPRSVLVENSSDEDSTLRRAELSPVSSKSSPKSLSLAQPIFFFGVRRRVVTVLVTNVVNFNLMDATVDERIRIHSDYVATVMDICTGSKGVCEPFAGDRMVVTFNAVTGTVVHQQSACRSALEIATANLAVTVRIGVCSANAECGNIGCNGMKKFAVLGPSVPAASLFCYMAKKAAVPVVTDERLSEEVCAHYTASFLTRIGYPKYLPEPFLLFYITGKTEVGEEEWMYQLQDAECPLKLAINNFYTTGYKDSLLTSAPLHPFARKCLQEGRNYTYTLTPASHFDL